ncbi:hypothetical protein HZZ00_24780 [Streptomyces sp. NEAU-sy36]|uniref:hypothetical protein n=1 Tax=unclassified Streptomyces TaxID=2593676 RepID=UPI0015D631B8|nr:MULTISPECIES: hypothetical protein [unclassified Streptomyces]QLJ03892.1 hypothetical protein HZZ00_24780 [Streptomyces sp. NEAU-sy36]
MTDDGRRPHGVQRARADTSRTRPSATSGGAPSAPVNVVPPLAAGRDQVAA